MHTRQQNVVVENARLVEVDTSHWFDALLERAPLRPAVLAAPPAGSGLKPVIGDRGIPFAGLGINTVRHGPAFQAQLMRRHGPVSWWGAFGRKVVAASGPDAAREVLTNKDKAFASGWPAVIGPWFDGGLLAMNGTEHLTDRRLMQAAYAEDALDGYLRRMAADADTYVARWPRDRRFPAVPALRTLSGQMTTMALLGVPYEPEGRAVMTAVEECIRAETALLRLPVPGTRWHRAHRARSGLLAHLADEVPAARVRAGEDFLSVLSRLGGTDSAFTTERLALHMLFTLIASHDTTTTAAFAAVYFLGKHPEWQDRARAESDASAGMPPGMARLRTLETLELVVKESIRLVSPSPIAMRVTTKDTDILGHYVPAGHLVSVCTAVNQLMPELWPEPHRFDPDRFAGSRGEDRAHRLAWLPFGAGPHKCIGMHFGMAKVKATLDALLRRFTWSFPATYEAPWRFTSLPAPSDGLPVVLRERT